MEEISFRIEELLAAIAFILSGGGMGTIIAKNKGWITFGKPTERRNCTSDVRRVCEQHNAMVVNLSNVTSDVTEMKAGQARNRELLHDIAGKVDRLVGYHQGKNGINLNH